MKEGRKMMKKLFPLLAMMLVFCLVLTACGGAGTESASGSGTKATNGTVTEKNTVENPSPMGKYDPAITMTFARPFDPNGESAALLKKSFNETVDENRWSKYFKDTLGITIQNKLMAPGGDQYSQKIKLAMASGDLPEFVRIEPSFLSDVRSLVDAGTAVELGQLYEKYASPLFREITEMEGKNIFDMATFNGKIYGIPLKQTSTDAYNHLWIRQDWLDNLGLQRPKTMDDVLNLAKAFVKSDPDGNSQNDTIGILIEKDFLWQSKGIFWAYGAYPNSPTQWIKSSEGKLVYATVQPEMKKGLAFIRNLYKEGLMDKEFGAKDFNKAFESAVNGKIGMFYGPHWSAWAIDNVVKNDPKAKWISVALPTEDGSTVKIPITVATSGVVIATNKAAHPEALVKLFNAYEDKLFSENRSADSAKFWADGGYEFWNLPPIHALHPMVDLQSHRDIKKAVAEGTTDKLVGSSKEYYQFMQEGMLPWELMFGPKDTPFCFVDATYPQQVIWNEYNSAPTPTMAARWSNMEELINTTFVKIINGELEIDTGFDNMVAEWNKMGGEKVTQEVNDLKK